MIDMKQAISAVLALGLSLTAEAAWEGGWKGYVGVEARLFFEEPLYPYQEDNSGALVAEPEYKAENGDLQFVFHPYFLLDSADDERTHADARELYLGWTMSESFRAQIGVGKVFWGQTEFLHLTDIVNQTDLVVYPEGEDKLGQPMVRLDWSSGDSTFSAFLLPYFRERTFAGKEGRLRFEPWVDADEAIYESGAKQHHVDLALRYYHLLGEVELGLSYFNGTGRDPSISYRFDQAGQLERIPYYEQIQQAGLEFLWSAEAWLWKLEAIYRTDQQNLLGQEDDYLALTGGFEYTFSDAGIDGAELGLIAEYMYDQRDELATQSFANDLFVGARLGLNDAASTELLLGFSHDLDGYGDLFKLEGSMRIGESMKLSADALVFFDQEPFDYLYELRDDSFLQLRMSYYF